VTTEHLEEVRMTYIQESAHRVSDAPGKGLDSYRAVDYRLIPDHYLRTPFVVTRPLKRTSATLRETLGKKKFLR
jgi:hypothetical protein